MKKNDSQVKDEEMLKDQNEDEKNVETNWKIENGMFKLL